MHWFRSQYRSTQCPTHNYRISPFMQNCVLYMSDGTSQWDIVQWESNAGWLVLFSPSSPWAIWVTARECRCLLLWTGSSSLSFFGWGDVQKVHLGSPYFVVRLVLLAITSPRYADKHENAVLESVHCRFEILASVYLFARSGRGRARVLQRHGGVCWMRVLSGPCCGVCERACSCTVQGCATVGMVTGP